ncbi:MAG: hypothetical protein AAGF15_07505 [Pseudomonadota bacterium]
MKFHVTLKSTFKRGDFYWVCDVNADTEDEAVVAAEHLFLEVTEKQDHWEFSDFQVERAS